MDEILSVRGTPNKTLELVLFSLFLISFSSGENVVWGKIPVSSLARARVIWQFGAGAIMMFVEAENEIKPSYCGSLLSLSLLGI